MEPASKEFAAEGADSDQILDLVHQGLLPLPLKSILVARVVCKHWKHNVGCLIPSLTLPYDAWSGCSSSSSSAATPGNAPASGTPAADTRAAAVAGAVASAAMAAYQSGDRANKRRRRAVQLREARDGSSSEEEGAADDGEDEWVLPGHAQKPRSKGSRQRSSRAAAAASGVGVGGERSSTAAQQQAQQQQQQQQGQQQQRPEQQLLGSSNHDEQLHQDAAAAALAAEGGAAAAATDSSSSALASSDAEHLNPEPLTHTPSRRSDDETQQLPQTTAVAGAAAAVAAAGAAVAAPARSGRHPLHQLPCSFPCCSNVTLLCHNLQPDQAALAASIQLLGAMPKLNTLVMKGSLHRSAWQQVLNGLQGQQQQQAIQQQQEIEQQEIEQQQQQLVKQQGIEQEQQQLGLLEQEGIEQQQQQLLLAQQQVLPPGPLQHQGLRVKLVSLQLVGVDLPPPAVLEGIVGLTCLKELTLHASSKSTALQVAHLDALSCGSQLQVLSLCVYQAPLRFQLDPLMALTALRSLEVMYRGIFNDQRPVLQDSTSISRLTALTSLASSGLGQPLMPHPVLTGLISLSATGLIKRLPEASVKLLATCSSLKQLRLEAGKRGIAAVAADQIHHLAAMKGITSLSLGLSKGGLPASKSSQQLVALAGLSALKGLALSANHNLGFSSGQLGELAGQWRGLESLRLASFNPLQGLAGFGAFTGLLALSLKPAVGTGKLLFELKQGLEPLQRLKRLHLDFRSALKVEHVEEVAEACSSRLQHLSLNMRASNIGSKAIVAIAQLTCLTSLQLLNTRTATLSGPPAAVALRSMTQLKWLSVQAAEEAVAQQPLELGQYLGNGLEGLEGLQELRVWLGFGVEARQAEGQLVGRVEAAAHSCRCHVLPEPEKPML